MVTGSERRERRKVAQRAAIKAAAVRLALDKGLERLTVEAISEAADISPRTFFNYFSAKEDALSMEPSTWTAEEIRAELAARPAGEKPLDSLRVVVKAMAEAANLRQLPGEMELLRELYQRYPELFGKAGGEDVDETFAVLTAELAGRMGTDPAHDLRPHLLVSVAFVAMQTAVKHSWAEESRRVEDLIDEAFDLLAAGL